MINRISLMLASLFMGLSFLASPVLVAAQAPAPPAPSQAAKDQVCAGIGGCGAVQGEKGVNDVVKLVVNILSAIVAVAAVLVIVFAGFRYVIAMGDSSKIASAKDTIIYAIVGLIIAAMAQVIVRFVLNKV